MKASHGTGRHVSLIIQDGRPICKESRVVLRSAENTTCVILAKTGSYSLQRLQHIIDEINKY